MSSPAVDGRLSIGTIRLVAVAIRAIAVLGIAISGTLAIVATKAPELVERAARLPHRPPTCGGRCGSLRRARDRGADSGCRGCAGICGSAARPGATGVGGRRGATRQA